MAGLGLFSSPDRERQDLEQYATSLPKPTEQASLMAKVLQTWPARLAQSAYSAATLPGEVLRNPDTAMDVLSGARDMSQETFNRATDLASIPMVATTGAPAGALGAGPVRPGIRAYHGSPHDFSSFRPSERGPLGAGVYLTPDEQLAKRYARDGKTYEASIAGEIFDGLGSRYSLQTGEAVNPYEVWRNQFSRLADAADDATKPAIRAIGERYWPGDGYPVFTRLSQELGGPERAAELLKRAGYSGISGNVDGREISVFTPEVIDILRKYGLAGLTAGGAVAASSGQSEAGENSELVAALLAARDRQRGHGVQ